MTVRRVVLTGFRGTGKTDTGRVLARRFGVPFIDTDALIELTTGRKIADIFRDDGEARFRAIERDTIASLPPADAVISTGGGAVMDPGNVERLHRDSTVVLLTADPEVITERIEGTGRPSLTGLPLRDEVREVLGQRRQAYRAASDLCIDTGSTTPAEAANAIFARIRDGDVSVAARARALTFFRSGRIPGPGLSRLEEILGGDAEQPRILGVAGNPCIHSRGPALFNALFARYGLRYHYTWFEHPEIKEILEIARGLSAKGLSVTIPFKQEVMGYLEGIDEIAATEIAAVNTVVFGCGGSIGYNTDWIGIREPLAGLKGSKAVLLGAGGVAAAAAYALSSLGMELTIINRTEEKARSLADRSGCSWAPWDAFDTLHPDLVVNATPVGMHPDTKSPLKEDQLEAGMTVFDLVYTPAETPLLRAAQKRGCRIIPGTEMFIGQAREQFRLFFGIDVPAGIIRENLI